MKKSFIPHPLGESRRNSIRLLIKAIVTLKDPRILDEHRKLAINYLLWAHTEADGKHNTPYWSVEALDCDHRPSLRHEHVATRKSLKEALLNASPDEIDRLLTHAVGCMVTEEEHRRLPHDSTFGWDRYEKGQVPYVDLRKLG